MSLDRVLVPVYFVWMLIAAIVAPIAVNNGWLDETRFALCAVFLAGAVFSIIGYLRYIPAGAKVPALLVLLVGKSLIFALLGLAFFIIAVGQGGSTNINLSLLLTYSVFGAAGAAKFFTGVYVLVGAGRGWISREVYKFPWLDGDSKKFKGDKKEDR